MNLLLSQPLVIVPVLVAFIAMCGALAGAVITARSALKVQKAKTESDAQIQFYRDLGDQVTKMAIRVDALMKGMETAQLNILTCIRERNELALELKNTRWELGLLAKRGDEVDATLHRHITDLEAKVGEVGNTPITGQISGTITVAPTTADSPKE